MTPPTSLKSGEIPDSLLYAFDQHGKKIPSHLLPPDQRDVALLESLPDRIPASWVSCPDRGPRYIKTSFFGQDSDIIPQIQIDGHLIHLGSGLVDAPFLQHVGKSAIVPYAETVLFPKLKCCGEDLLIQSALQADISHLERTPNRIDVAMLTHVHLPNLEVAGEINADTSERIHLPNLGGTPTISAPACKHAVFGKLDREACQLELGDECTIETQNHAA